ncbi:MAG: type III secretion system chaperone [Parachlamydiaceae bacterium]|nr:MAG: type III secretion system chaperone [Parachlamydiaceae bacterium]
MDLEDILIEYGKSMNLGKLQLDSSGVCTILINDNLISFEKTLDKEGFYLYASIGSLPPDRELSISLMALEANLFGKETGHANIGYEEQSRTLVLFEYFHESSLDYGLFMQRFNEFAQYLFYWITKLESVEHLPQVPREEENLSKQKKIYYA